MSRSATYTYFSRVRYVLAFVYVFFCLHGFTQTNLSLKASASDLQVHLTWTADSSATDHFIIEQSSDDINYKTVGVVRWSKDLWHYTYEYPAQKGKNSFRIRFVYPDKESQYSNTVLLNVGYKINVTAFPNPSTGRFTLSHPLASGKEQVQITNTQGTVVHQVNIARSSVHTVFDLSHLEKTTYHLVWQDEFGKVTLKLFIQ